jgi:diguanylate cyclase (GGDEF)-like protein
MESIAILVIEKGRARVMRFRVELAGEACWSLACHTTSEVLKRLKPDLVTVVKSERRAHWLAEELRRQGRADAVILLHPESESAAPGQPHISISGPFDPSRPRELVLQLAKALLEAQSKEPANPLTGLPGASVLRAEVEGRIEAGETFVFLYLDLDNFKAYNDFYGFAKGDEAIKTLSEQVKAVVAERGKAEDICVHIGGDDFGILTVPERAQKIAEALLEKFDKAAPNLYAEAERKRGYIMTKDRRGNEARFPIMTLSIAGVSNESRQISGYLHLSEIAAEIKAYAKDVSGSTYVQDRRQD